MTEQAYLLDDVTMRRFLTDGYMTLHAGFPAGFHEAIYQRLEWIHEKEGNPGNNILPRLPELQQVFDHPTVRGALTSILGPGYSMHPHRYGHPNLPGSEAQRLHKDTTAYSGDRDLRHHRCRWAMAFYYPQDVTEDMGATGIMPGSHYYETRSDAPENAEQLLCGPAGTVTIVHFDIWHRATANRSEKKRYMLKFLFARMEEPREPAWDTVDPAWRPAGSGASPGKHEGMWEHLWHWSRGAPRFGASDGDTSAAPRWTEALRDGDAAARRRAADALGRIGAPARDAIPALIRALGDGDEATGLNAAYALGAIGEPALPALIATLPSEVEPAGRHAAYALSAMGGPAVPALIRATRDANARVRMLAVDALGDIGPEAGDAVPALIDALRDECGWVRRHASDALGTIGPAAGDVAPALATALQHEQPYIRFNAATALAKIGPGAGAAVPALIATLNDGDRYVRAFAAMALQRIGTPEAREGLLEFLMTSRWCPITHQESRY